MKRPIFVIAFIFLFTFSFGQSFKKKYKGNIGPYLINVTITSLDGNISGTYYYDEFDDPISIRGFITGKSIEFKGYDLKGNQLDQFIGQISQHDVHGIWVGEEGQKRQSFNLKEDPSTYASGESTTSTTFNWPLIVAVALVLLLGTLFFIFRKRIHKRGSDGIKNIGSLFKSGPSSQQNRYEFEKFMTAKLNPEKYRLLEWRSDKINSNKQTTFSASPDLVFERKSPDHEKNKFSIECQYMNNKSGSRVDLGKDWKPLELKSYSMNSKKPLFVALGLGGQPFNPESVFVIPIEKIGNGIINISEVSDFKITGEQLSYDPEKGTLK